MWTPTILRESFHGPREIALRSELFNDRYIFLVGDITENVAIEFVAQLMHLKKTTEPINIVLDTNGGVVSAGLLIYDALQECKNEINIYCVEKAASMGAVILAGGQKGRRYIAPHATTMIHEPLVRNSIGGSASNIQRTSESILTTKSILNEILARHTGKSEEEINDAVSYDNFMNAEEAIAFGLCDAIAMPF